MLGTEVAANAALMSMGLDSIAAVEFASAVGEAVGKTSFSAIMLFDHPTVDSITSYLAAELAELEAQKAESLERVAALRRTKQDRSSALRCV